MRFKAAVSSILLLLLAGSAQAAAATDEYQDADPSQSGYLPNHNIHPNAVNSANFGELWRLTFNKNEKFYAKPLVYTPSAPGSRQIVLLASTQNKIYSVDAVNGTLIRTREVRSPFLVVDIGCTDLPNTVGIVGTPIIDPLTDIMYFFSKGYRGEESGLENGVFRFYAVNVLTFEDIPGYPFIIDGTPSESDPEKYFVGGTHNQRPSLALINNVVYGAFGSHCGQYNYAGWIFGIHTQSREIVSVLTTTNAPFTKPQTGTIDGGGGGSAIWQGGMGLSTDANNRLFFVTANGKAHQNIDTPASGKTPLKTLNEAVVHMKIDPETGKLSLFDYFQPFDYISLDAADKDLGASGLTMLDPATFRGQGVARMGVTAGKNAKAYVVNLDDLGGYKLGPGGSDNCIQIIQLDNPTFGGAGSYPLEGGYFYFTPTRSPLVAYKLGADSTGKPVFTLAGKSTTTIGGKMGPVTVTSYKSQEGTGIVWVCDNNIGLRAFYAVPENGEMVEITIPSTGGMGKFARPAFGDGRIYVANSNAQLIALGSPINPALNCDEPIDFGQLTIGQSKTVIVTCTGIIATKVNGAVVSDASFSVQNSSFPTSQVKKDGVFTFPVVWDLTTGSHKPGLKSAVVNILTTNTIAKYMTSQPLNIRGNIVSSGPFLDVNPSTVDFGGVIIGEESAAGVSVAFTISNTGSTTLQITKITFASTNQVNNTDITYSNVVYNGDGTASAGSGFTLTALPTSGQSIAVGASLSVTANFKAVNGVGNYNSVLKIESNGGTDKILLTGSAATAPKARFEIQNSHGQWEEKFSVDFGDVVSGDSSVQNIRLCNDGGSPLIVTLSKPPGGLEIFAPSAADDLFEGYNVPAGECGAATVKFQPLPMVPNTDPHTVSEPWVLNVNEANWDIHRVIFEGRAVSRQLGPLLPDGIARYRYLGCYQDGGNGRLFTKNTGLGDQATVGLCAQTGLNNSHIFAGTQYRRECWQGNTPPPSIYFYPEGAAKCTWGCTGDLTQPCGGNGMFMNIFYDSTRYTPENASISTTTSSTTSSTTTSSRTTTSSTTTITTTSSTTTSTTKSTTTSSSSSTTTSTTKSTTSSTSSTTTTFTTSTRTSTITSNDPSAPTRPATDPTKHWEDKGCWLDPPASYVKAVNPYIKYTTDLMTIQLCLDYCEARNYVWAGLEYRRECYCANFFIGEETSTCTNTCMGNTAEICGGSRRMNVYNLVDRT
ncbi:uncharacterized protein DFL_001379 [Arthrobotrys flagrans]|uniref:WSC domain-containing protein n=1 Tax=Arthrobotrys flagrans TaxID=97331 RepID=A0A437AGZ5_ARTFL|nr:hypothetical protein DFL_001379 [Arthrobotrys flagrans]